MRGRMEAGGTDQENGTMIYRSWASPVKVTGFVKCVWLTMSATRGPVRVQCSYHGGTKTDPRVMKLRLAATGK